MARTKGDLTSGELVALCGIALALDPEDIKGVFVVGISPDDRLRYTTNMCCQKHALQQAERWIAHLRTGEILGKVSEC